MDAGPPDIAGHWDKLYSQRTPMTLSWFQDRPAVSLALFDALRVSSDQAVIDVGGWHLDACRCPNRAGFW
jgi:hypothetical protein